MTSHAMALQSSSGIATRRSLFVKAEALLSSSPRRNRWRRTPCSRSEPDPDTDTYQFTYLGSDGRLKATFEQAFKGRKGTGATDNTAKAPWSVGYQMSERNLVWNDDLKARLVRRVVAEQLHMSDEEVEERLRQLQLLLPTLHQKLPGMKPQLVARLAANVPRVAAAIVQLKTIFPEADVSKLAVREPGLVLGFDMARLQQLAVELRELLPRLNVDRLVEENPSMLDVEGFKQALQEARRIMPSLDMQQALASDPQMIFGFQRGSQLIPYDEPRPLTQEEQEVDDDEYAAYYKW